MSSALNDNGLLEPVFAVEDVNDEFDLDIPPTSGMEYLKRVQMEAKQCPHVLVADIDTTEYNKKQTVRVSQSSGLHPAPHGFAPAVNWQKEQIAEFSRIRQKISKHKAKNKKQRLKRAAKLPRKENLEAWCRLCFGRIEPLRCSEETLAASSEKPDAAENDSDSASEDENPEDFSASPPLVSLVTAMDQATVVQVLEYHVNWFEATGFSSEQGRWFYALLAVLEKPISPEACSLLRSLARNCANLRASLEREDDAVLVPMNLFITLVAKYFDQIDMADDR